MATATAPKSPPRTAAGRRRSATAGAAAPRARAAAAGPRQAAPRPRARSATPAPSARRAAGRSAAAQAPRRSRQATPIPGRIVPLAAARTAGAVGGLADSGLVVRLTRGRLWIAALAALLVGIVGLNVVSLSLSSSSSETARAVEELQRQRSTLEARLAEELSSQRVQSVASSLGLVVPEPGAIGYLEPSADDAAEAARRLRSGELAAAPVVAPVVPEPLEPAVAAPEPVAEAAVAAPPQPHPVAAEPVAAAPTAEGGVAAP